MEAENEIKSDNFIQLKKNESILRLGIKDENGNDTGEFLEFNLEDIELPLKLQKIIDDEKRNIAYLKNQFLIIDKKQDHTGKKILSSKEEEKLKALIDFYKKEKELYDIFLGKGGVDKLLNGRELSWTTLAEINEIITKYIAPKIESNAEIVKERIISKFKIDIKGNDVIE